MPHWRNLGKVTVLRDLFGRQRPTRTKVLTCMFVTDPRSCDLKNLIRDEEAVGSNPATPTRCNTSSGPVFRFGGPVLNCVRGPVWGAQGGAKRRLSLRGLLPASVQQSVQHPHRRPARHRAPASSAARHFPVKPASTEPASRRSRGSSAPERTRRRDPSARPSGSTAYPSRGIVRSGSKLWFVRRDW